MAYPNTPDFGTASDSDAWWMISYPAADGSTAVAICSSGGRAFVDNLQILLHVGVDGKWGRATADALVGVLQVIGASSTLVNAIRHEASQQLVGTASLQGAVFLMHSGMSFGAGPIGIAEGAIAINPASIGPTWNTAAPAGPSGDMPAVCVLRGGGTGGGGGAPPVLPQPTVVTPGGTDGGGLPSKDTSTDTGIVPSVQGLPSLPTIAEPTSIVPFVILGVGVLAMGGAILWWRMPAKSSRGRGRRRK